MSGFAPVGVSLPVTDELAVPDLVRLAVAAEDEGYHTVFLGEIGGSEAFATLGAIAQATERIRLATGIVSVMLRTPALIAMGFRTLDNLAPGRIVCGLGVGSRAISEGWHGIPFEDTPQVLAETVDALRPAFAGERVTYKGIRSSADRFRVTIPDPRPIPIWVGALTPAGLRLAGRIADGALMAFCPPAEAARRVGLVRRAAVEAGRNPASIEAAAYVNSYAGPEVDVARERMKRLIAQTAIHPTHRPAFEPVFPAIDAATEAWNRGDRRAAVDLVPDSAVDAVTPVGDAGAIADRLEDLRTLGIDLPVLFPNALQFGDADSSEGTIRRVAEELRSRP
jgi:alkanesulfonate monooxygenase SsuD/methylene tetrahydromethanopterin reductase-like flavin-dependent oxidoreductase (luciferase family)